MFGMSKKEKPVFKLVKGRVLRCGPEPYRDSSDRFTVLLEGSAVPYRIYPRMGAETGRCFVELTQPGDIVSFTVEEGFLDASNFRNESLPAGLVQAYDPPKTS
jgi:hypothetical protein